MRLLSTITKKPKLFKSERERERAPERRTGNFGDEEEEQGNKTEAGTAIRLRLPLPYFITLALFSSFVVHCSSRVYPPNPLQLHKPSLLLQNFWLSHRILHLYRVFPISGQALNFQPIGQDLLDQFYQAQKPIQTPRTQSCRHPTSLGWAVFGSKWAQ